MLLARAFAEGAEERNRVQVLSVADLEVAPCRACNECFGNGHRCVQQDDMQKVYAAMAEADMLVLASPVYFYGVSAQLAAVVHRLHNPLRDDFHIRHAALLLAAASHKPHICDGIKLQYTMLLDNFHIENCGMVVAQGVSAPGDVAKTEFLEEARKLGRSI